ncbi:MAG: dTDP-4-amino-4,6-dideoxygalactose transaminase [Lentimicrobiaceae bacterium]|jgi:dTDP-4-amino-4,6-dideoxygalactose transaminase|nr:dTDP-4-amino-4,6-dideoxygalactose transaminase [Lentimicrobiaceae bacterium]MDG1900634.1 dTDP-4-amino-4,6-dideoxygalactose transaminase [Bacteroidales bacterium]MDG2081353.1 dTDP-4-amino-4,6-dideoxygalactose transaminase [Bacteroidales bacterium]
MVKIPFNKPWFTGKEIQNITSAASFGHISSNGIYTQKCHSYFEIKYGFKKVFLTSSCTDAMEMAAILMNLKSGDEIVMPSYTFVSTTSPFILRGASIAFADSLENHPNIDLDHAEELINDRTKALMVMHYGGVAVDMDKAVYLAEKYNLILLEDTAHSVDSYYKGKPLGSFGQFSTCSFHETKNISSGEGGMLVVNDEKYIPRAEIIWEKGTNRSAFSRGEISKYEWVDVGSSFNPSDMIAAFLYAQLNYLEDIQETRIKIWHRYEDNLKVLANGGRVELPLINDYATNNGHVFYLVTGSKSERDNLLKYLNSEMIQAVFHYLPLHNSPYYKNKYDGKPLLNAQKFADRLIRLPLFYELPLEIVDMICNKVVEFYEK